MRKILVFLIFLSISTAAAGPEDLQWIHLDNSDDVRSVYRTGDSLWIGTNGGLFVYDLLNETFTAKHNIGPFLSSNSVRIITGRGDSVLVGTDEGLSVFTEDSVYIHDSDRSPVFSDLRSIDFSPTGSICLGTYGHGVGVIRGEVLSIVTRLDSLLDDRVFSVLQMDDTTFFYATSLGICAFRDSLWEDFRVGAGLPGGEVRDLLLTEDYAMYALISGEGVFYFDGVRGRRVTPRGLFLDNEITAIGMDPSWTLWAAGRFGGISKYRFGQWLDVGAMDEAIATTPWRCLFPDGEGSVYFGSADGLVMEIKMETVRKVRVPSDLPSNNVRAAAEDSAGYRYLAVGSQLLSAHSSEEVFTVEGSIGPIHAMTVSPAGELWCSTRWGLYQKKENQLKEVPIRLSGSAPIILSITFDASGNLWAGTDMGEVLRFDGDIWLRMGEKDELTGGGIRRIVFDTTGDLWALSKETGVSRFNGTRWENFSLDPFGGELLSDISLDPGGRPVVAGARKIWSYGGNGSWRPFDIPPLGPEIRLEKIHFDRLGRVYLGTSEGLMLLGDGYTRFFGPHEGIGGTEVSTLMIDSGGLLWVGFRKDGLSFIPVDQLW